MGMIPNSMAWHATIWADAQPKFVQLPLEVKLQFVRDPKIYFYFSGIAILIFLLLNKNPLNSRLLEERNC